MRVFPRLLFSIVSLYFTAALALAVLRPWYRAHLYVPINGRNYFTIDNHTDCWDVRVGYVGGIDGFDFALTQTNPDEEALRAKLFPFPATWIIDWYFYMKLTSPFFLMGMPLYFPVIVFGAWPAWTIVMHMRRRSRSLMVRHSLSTFVL